MTNRAVLLYAGVFAAAFGLLVYWMSRRKGLPAAGLTTFLGIAGVYTGFWGVTERRHWPYAPAVVLMLASSAIDFAARRRSRPRDSSPEAADPNQRPE
jgi:hypothetical protein